MNTTVKHTPAGNWKVGTTEPDKVLKAKRAMVIAEKHSGNPETICVVSGLIGQEPGEVAKANADFIVTACNSFSPLLEALKEMTFMAGIHSADHPVTKEWKEKIRAAQILITELEKQR